MYRGIIVPAKTLVGVGYSTRLIGPSPPPKQKPVPLKQGCYGLKLLSFTCKWLIINTIYIIIIMLNSTQLIDF